MSDLCPLLPIADKTHTLRHFGFGPGAGLAHCNMISQITNLFFYSFEQLNPLAFVSDQLISKSILQVSRREGAMFESSGFFKGVWADGLCSNIKKTCEITVAVLKKYQPWLLLILAIDAHSTMTSVLIHDFPGKAIFQLVWLLVFGTALIIIILSNELGDTTSRLGWLNAGVRLAIPLRSVTRLS